jgi:hypothetical protein
MPTSWADMQPASKGKIRRGNELTGAQASGIQTKLAHFISRLNFPPESPAKCACCNLGSFTSLSSHIVLVQYPEL